jgi:transposase
MAHLRLTTNQEKKLRQELKRTTSTSAVYRCLALLLLNEGRPLASLARLLGVSRQIIYVWLKRFGQCPRLSALKDKPRSGRPPVWNAHCREVLRTSLDYAPDQFGYPAANWTAGLLADHLALCLGQKVSARSLRRQLHALGYVWKRPRYALTPDPQREKKACLASGCSRVASKDCDPL